MSRILDEAFLAGERQAPQSSRRLFFIPAGVTWKLPVPDTIDFLLRNAGRPVGRILDNFGQRVCQT
jgi:hypothetical protein